MAITRIGNPATQMSEALILEIYLLTEINLLLKDQLQHQVQIHKHIIVLIDGLMLV